jgi:protocatechuate 4,5-dioxygenase alpha chain
VVVVAEKPATEVAGTYVFDGIQSRRGYPLNKLCMSLRDPANRARFTRDEATYCDQFSLSPEQKHALLSRDWPRMLDLGGNIFFIVKLAMADQKSMQYLGGAFTGMTEDDFVAMMLAGGRNDG